LFFCARLGTFNHESGRELNICFNQFKPTMPAWLGHFRSCPKQMDNTTVVNIEFFMTAEISKGLLVRALSCQRQVLCKSFKGYCVNVTTDGRPDNRAERACVSLPCCTGTRHDDATAHGGVNSASRLSTCILLAFAVLPSSTSRAHA